MRNMLVPHVGHVPLTAGLPFFSLVSLGFFISRFVLHFTQYASVILRYARAR